MRIKRSVCNDAISGLGGSGLVVVRCQPNMALSIMTKIYNGLRSDISKAVRDIRRYRRKINVPWNFSFVFYSTIFKPWWSNVMCVFDNPLKPLVLVYSHFLIPLLFLEATELFETLKEYYGL